MRTSAYKTTLAAAAIAGLLCASFPALPAFAAASTVHIASSNPNPAVAKVGDTVTLTFTETSSTTPVVTIDGRSASVSGGPSNWTATYTLQSSDTEGSLPFSINVGGDITSTTTDSSSVFFDRTAPTVALSSTSTNATTGVNPIPVTVTFSEPVSGLFSSSFIIGNGSLAGFGSQGDGIHYSLMVQPSAAGSVTVDLNANKAFDLAGNGNLAAPQFQRIFNPNMASTSPTLTMTSGPADGATIATSTVTFTFTSNASTTCTFGGAPYQCGSPQTFTGLGDSTYVFEVDAANAAGTTTVTRHFTIDPAGPTISITGGPADGATIATSTVTFTFTSNASTTVCTFGGAPYFCTSPQIFTGLGDSTYIFKVQATNGSATSTASTTFTIAHNAPVIAEVTPVPSGTNPTPPFTFSSTQAGTIAMGGGCSTAATSTTATSSKTITLNALGAGTYASCTLVVTNASGTPSNTLTLTQFTISGASSGGSSGGGGGNSGSSGSSGSGSNALSLSNGAPAGFITSANAPAAIIPGGTAFAVTPSNTFSPGAPVVLGASTARTSVSPSPRATIATRASGPASGANAANTGASATLTPQTPNTGLTSGAPNTGTVTSTTPLTPNTGTVDTTGFSVPSWAWIAAAVVIVLILGWVFFAGELV